MTADESEKERIRQMRLERLSKISNTASPNKPDSSVKQSVGSESKISSSPGKISKVEIFINLWKSKINLFPL